MASSAALSASQSASTPSKAKHAAVPPQPRLAVKSLVLENFKSYAGRQEIGPFHRSFTSVVGPNGSGKSNVMDGILFVFGKQAKQLRLNKVSELIHNSEQFPNLDAAKVTVYFYDVVPKVRPVPSAISLSPSCSGHLVSSQLCEKIVFQFFSSNIIYLSAVLSGQGETHFPPFLRRT